MPIWVTIFARDRFIISIHSHKLHQKIELCLRCLAICLMSNTIKYSKDGWGGGGDWPPAPPLIYFITTLKQAAGSGVLQTFSTKP